MLCFVNHAGQDSITCKAVLLNWLELHALEMTGSPHQTAVRDVLQVGHSMGGLISARYALKYPEHVEHLILVCPAGIVRLYSLLPRSDAYLGRQISSPRIRQH